MNEKHPAVGRDRGFNRHSTVRQVLDRLGDRGREALLAHGFDTGQGFVDVLSQHQTLEMGHRTGHIRDLEGLVVKLNPESASPV